MAFQPKLTPKQKIALIEDYRDGWRIRDLTIIYRVSERTVYRILAEYSVPPRVYGKKRKRRYKEKKPKVLKPCGTNAAYARHKRAGEYPCTPCLEAHAANVAKYTRKNHKL